MIRLVSVVIFWINYFNVIHFKFSDYITMTLIYAKIFLSKSHMLTERDIFGQLAITKAIYTVIIDYVTIHFY